MTLVTMIMPGVILVAAITMMIAVIALAGGISSMLMCFVMMAGFIGFVSLLSLFDVGHSLALLVEERIPRVDA